MQIQDRLLHSCIRVDEVVPDVKRNVPAKSNDFFLCGGARWAESTLSVNRSLFFFTGGGCCPFQVQRAPRAVYDKAKMASSYAAGK